MSGSVRVEWAGVEWGLLPDRALWLPREAALIIADWHLGKGDVFRRAGIPLPSGSTIADFARLDALLAHTGARQLVILGDLLHGRVSADAGWVEDFVRWRERHPQLALRVARGNHDRALGALMPWLDEVGERLLLGPAVCRHALDIAALDWQLAGHVHPCIRVSGAGLNERVAVFWIHAKGFTLPAFGTLTGGYEIAPVLGDRLFAALPDCAILLPNVPVRRFRRVGRR